MHRHLPSLALLSVFCLAASPPPPPAFDQTKALTALAKWSHHTIAKNHTHCEINGYVPGKGDSVPNPVRVQDVLVKHILWSLKESTFKVQGFDCEQGETDGKNKKKSKKLLSCRLWFGEKEELPKSDGWSLSLVFPYDPVKDEVKAADIQCVKVP